MLEIWSFTEYFSGKKTCKVKTYKVPEERTFGTPCILKTKLEEISRTRSREGWKGEEACSPLRVFPSRVVYENNNQRLLPRIRLGSHEKLSIIRGMNTYPIFDSPLQRSVRRSFAPLQNRANRSPIWYGQFVPVTYSLSPEIYPVQMLSLWDCIPCFWLKAPNFCTLFCGGYQFRPNKVIIHPWGWVLEWSKSSNSPQNPAFGFCDIHGVYCIEFQEPMNIWPYELQYLPLKGKNNVMKHDKIKGLFI